MLPVNVIGQNPSYERQARPVNFFANPSVIPTVGTPVERTNSQYSQYDNSLEHGYGGVQCRDGAVLGAKLNLEF